jgi:hypothetical protein
MMARSRGSRSGWVLVLYTALVFLAALVEGAPSPELREPTERSAAREALQAVKWLCTRTTLDGHVWRTAEQVALEHVRTAHRLRATLCDDVMPEQAAGMGAFEVSITSREMSALWWLAEFEASLRPYGDPQPRFRYHARSEPLTRAEHRAVALDLLPTFLDDALRSLFAEVPELRLDQEAPP